MVNRTGSGVAKLDGVVCARRCQDSPEFLKAALAATGDVVMVIDDRGTIEFASAAAVRVLGRPAGSYRDRSLYDLVHLDDRAVLADELATIADRTTRRRSRLRAAHASGRWIDVEATFLPPTRDVDGTETMLVLRDVTELAAAEREVDQLQRVVKLVRVADDRPVERSYGAADVAQALATGRLELHYQPIRDVDSGRVAGFEGLLRWNHPDDGLLAASEFLPVVEDSDLIVDIGAFVFEQGCAQLARWQQAYGPYAPMLSLNVSARQLLDADFSGLVGRELERAGADPSGLCLELTDTHVFDGQPEVMAELQRVRATGTKIALDEFGTGSSSLRQLQQLGADVLKIDRTFVHQVGLDDGATAIVRAAIEFGVAFGMTTIAEGVTTVEQHRLLLSLGCDRVQGFLIAPALPADLADAMLGAESAIDRPGSPDGEHDRVTVRDARGRLASIDEQYLPSEDEVAALAGVSAFAARSGLNRGGRDRALS